MAELDIASSLRLNFRSHGATVFIKPKVGTQKEIEQMQF